MVATSVRPRRSRRRRRSRRSNNTSRRIANIAARCPIQSRLPRDPPAIPSGFDHVVRVPFLVRMIWNPDPDRTTGFGVSLATLPTAPSDITLYARWQGSTSYRQYYLDYEEIWAAAFMRATGQDFSTVNATTKAVMEFALLSAKVWGPLTGGGGLTLRVDGGPTLSGGSGNDIPGRNHRAVVGFTYPTVDWQKFHGLDTTTPAVLVDLSRVDLMALAPLAAGTSFGFENQIDLGAIHLTVRMRFHLSIMNREAAGFSLAPKAETVFQQLY